MLKPIDKGILYRHLLLELFLLAQYLLPGFKKLLVQAIWGRFRALKDVCDRLLLILNFVLEGKVTIVVLKFRGPIGLKFDLNRVELCFKVSQFCIDSGVIFLQLLIMIDCFPDLLLKLFVLSLQFIDGSLGVILLLLQQIVILGFFVKLRLQGSNHHCYFLDLFSRLSRQFLCLKMRSF